MTWDRLVWQKNIDTSYTADVTVLLCSSAKMVRMCGEITLPHDVAK